MTNIYFGAGLFTQGDREFNGRVVERIRGAELGEVYSPAENMSINNKAHYASGVDIFRADNDHLENSDILIAVLDGDVIDAGLACEVGYFARMAETDNEPRMIIGLLTDIRQGNATNEKIEALEELAESPFLYVNTYVTGAIKSNGTIVDSVPELIDEIARFNVERGPSNFDDYFDVFDE